MLCKRCNKEINDNLICPHCGFNEIANNKYDRVIKNKYLSEDNSYLVGSEISKNKSFLNLNKKKNKKNNSSKITNQFQSKVSTYINMFDKNNNLVGDKDNFITVSKSTSKFKFKGEFYIYIFLIIFWVVIISLFINSKNNNDYYFSEDKNNSLVNEKGQLDEEMSKYEGVSKSGQDGGYSTKGVTAIVYDNQYLEQFLIKDYEDVEKLIVTDSIKQKDNCPTKILKIEKEIVNYGIVAVNLCEMDIEFASEIRNVVKNIYYNYPNARNYLTNLTLANVDENSSFIAAFMPIFTFATSNSSTGYPVGIKSQILLNAKYFLNTSKLQSSVKYGSKSGYFPPNTTRSSTVAHEFGHYLSYVSMLKYYKTDKLNFINTYQITTLYDVYDDFNDGSYSYSLLKEAYEVYCKLYGNMYTFDEFRGSISKYALAKDSRGFYIYDETIAEAFHDYYVNGDKAAIASKVIVDVLKSRL